MELDLDINIFDDDIGQCSTKGKNTRFNLERSFNRLKDSLRLPKTGESIRTISPAGGWSSCSMLMWLLDSTNIDSVFISTFRVGKKELKALLDIMDSGQLNSLEFVLSDASKYNNVSGKHYDYADYFEKECNKRGIKYKYMRNHSKVIMCSGKYIIETSSNFNENPKIEQFILSKSNKIYDFYKESFIEIGVING